MARKLSYFHPAEGIVRVKRGFSWPAFALGSVWAVAKRLWFPVLAVLVPLEVLVWFVTGYAEAQEDDALSIAGLLAALLMAFLRGRYGNRWHEAQLVRRGYVPYDRAGRDAQGGPVP